MTTFVNHQNKTQSERGFLSPQQK